MGRRYVWVALPTVLTVAGNASAQPLFRNERNWTVDGAEGRRYGVRDVVEAANGTRETQFCVGYSVVRLHSPVGRLAELLPVAALLGVRRGCYWVRDAISARSAGP